MAWPDQPNAGVGVLEVEPLPDLLGSLVQGIVHFLTVHLADDVERALSCHLCCSISEMSDRAIVPNRAVGFTGGWLVVVESWVLFLPAAGWRSARHGRLPERPKGAVCKIVG